MLRISKKQGRSPFMNSKALKFLLLGIAVFLSTCASSPITNGGNAEERRVEREKIILEGYSDEKGDKYASLLVDPERYTTNGAEYQKKYYRHIIGIAAEIVEKKKMTIETGSMGFYYDRKSADRDKLYLGLDLVMGEVANRDYAQVAQGLIDTNLKLIMETMNSCKTLFLEDQIVGMVIGFKWTAAGEARQINVWMLEDEVMRYENSRITFDELVHRSTLTNTEGKVIMLTR
jgi:hypothetical protein